MAPNLTEDEVDDLLYFSRAGEDTDLEETLKALSEREQQSSAEILIAAKDEGKSTVLHMATGNGHLGTVRKILSHFDSAPKEQKQAFLDESNEHGNTGLHWAALGGHLETVKLLLEQGASPAMANERNYVPLDLANFNDHSEVAQYFLSFSNDAEVENGKTGLDGAAEGLELEDEEEEGEDSKGKAP